MTFVVGFGKRSVDPSRRPQRGSIGSLAGSKASGILYHGRTDRSVVFVAQAWNGKDEEV